MLALFRFPGPPSHAGHGAGAGVPGHCGGDAGAAGDHPVAGAGQHLPVHTDAARGHAQTVQAAPLRLRVPR